MGVVNTGSGRLGYCYRSLTEIDPRFTVDTPIYLVINSMIYDSAEYCVDTSEAESFSGDAFRMWICYPEKGKIHVSISTTKNTFGQAIRTVKCICESGRVYTNTFTKNTTPIFEKGTYDICFADIITLLKYSKNPASLTIEDKDLLSVAYGKPVAYDVRFTGVDGISPAMLLSTGRIFDIGLGIANAGVSADPDGNVPSDYINKVTYDDIIELSRTCCDIQTIPYILADMYLYGLDAKQLNTHQLKDYVPISYLGDGSVSGANFDIYAILGIYKITREWTYSGWTCIDMAETCHKRYTVGYDYASGDPIDIDYIWANALSNTEYVKLISGFNNEVYSFVSDEIYGNSLAFKMNTSKAVTGYDKSISVLRSIRRELDKIAPCIPFKPFDTSVHVFYIKKSVFETDTALSDIFYDLPNDICIDNEIDLSQYEDIKFTFILHGNNMSLHVDMEYWCDEDGKYLVDNGPDTKYLKDVWAMLPTTTVNIPETETETSEYISIGNDAYLSNISDSAPVFNMIFNGKTSITDPVGSKTTENPATISHTNINVYSLNQNIFSFDNIVWSTDILSDGFTDDGGEPIEGKCSEFIKLPEIDNLMITIYGINYACTYGDTKNVIQAYRSTDNVITINPAPEIKYIRVMFPSSTTLSHNETCSAIVFGDNDIIPAVHNEGIDLPELMSIGDISDTIYKRDNMWYIDKRIYKSTITYTNDAIYLNNMKVTPVYDATASTPSSGIYVFHLVSESASMRSGYGILTPSNDGSMATGSTPGDMLLHGGIYTDSTEIISPNADTTKTINCGYDVYNGATAVSDVSEYAIQINSNGVNSACGITYKAVSAYPYKPTSACQFVYGDSGGNTSAAIMRGYSGDYDKYGNKSVFHYPKIMTIAVKLDPDQDNVDEALNTKLASKPIIFYYAPKFTAYEYFGEPRFVTINVLDDINGQPNGLGRISVTPLTTPLSRELQSKLNNCRIYRNGFIKVMTENGIHGDISITYARDITKVMNDLEARMKTLEGG